MPEVIVTASRPIGARLPIFPSRVQSDSSRIETRIAQAEPGDMVRFVGMFFCDRPLSFGGEYITYRGRDARFYFLPDKEYPYRIEVRRDAYGLSIQDIYCVDWPTPWFKRLLSFKHRRSTLFS